MLSLFIRKNLEVQGFTCREPQFERIEPWLRWNPTLCFIIASFGLLLASPGVFFILSAIAAIGAFYRHGVGDLLYNYGIRFFTGTPSLPPNPSPRRFACFVGFLWSLAIAFAFSYGYPILAYTLGIMFLLVVIPMIAFHYCIASLIYQKVIGYHPLPLLK